MSSFEEENEELSDAEKLQISQHFLLSSPPGQFNEVLTECKKLVGEEILTEASIANTARAFNNKTLRVVTAPSGQKAVLSAASEVDSTHYKDNNNTVFAVDHVSLETTESAVDAESDDLELHRSALQSALDTYVASKFLSATTAGTVVVKNGQLQLLICSEKPNLRNFWSGKWTSVWTVAIDGSSASVNGHIKIHAHYFEDGNVQMVSNKKCPDSNINFNSEADLAAEVIKIVKAAETSLQTGLEDMYTNMNEETFKSMRRIMPITRTKMDWNLNSVRMVRQVRK